ncbi:MAG: radical SAM protein [Candidatus Delongbacteria bacterium]|nr:radical SAM protein [Candidatus Delongbacteria bacterium]
MSDPLHVISAPTSVFIAITGRCNLNCKHCNVGDHQNRNYYELSTEEWKGFFRELESLRVFQMRISGGEPFVRKDIYELFDYIQARPFWMDINTNAILVDEAGARRIGNYPHVGNILVSLDGSTAAVYEQMRGPNTFKAAIRGMENLLKYNRRRVSFYCTVTQTNVNDIENMIKLVKDWPSAGIKFNHMMPGGNADLNREMALTPLERRRLSERMVELKEKYSIVSGTILDTYHMFKDFETRYDKIKDSNPHPRLVSGCNSVRHDITVRFEGNVTPCDRLSHMVCGNILQQSFQDIWLNSPLLNEFRRRMKITLADFEDCRNCPYNCLCSGGCPAIPYSLGKGIFSQDPFSCYKVYNVDESHPVPQDCYWI